MAKDYRSLEFGRYLRSRRAYEGWSQDELADKLGVTQATVSRLETAEIFPSLDHIWRLAPVLNTEPEKLARVFWDAPIPESEELREMENTKQEEQEPPANKSDAAAKRARDADTINQLRKRKEKEQVEKDKGGLIKN